MNSELNSHTNIQLVSKRSSTNFSHLKCNNILEEIVKSILSTSSRFYVGYLCISKYNVGLKTLLSDGLLEPEFYGDLVYKFKKLIGNKI